MKIFLCQMAAKYEVEKEQEARMWIEAILREPIDPVSSHCTILGTLKFA